MRTESTYSVTVKEERVAQGLSPDFSEEEKKAYKEGKQRAAAALAAAAKASSGAGLKRPPERSTPGGSSSSGSRSVSLRVGEPKAGYGGVEAPVEGATPKGFAAPTILVPKRPPPPQPDPPPAGDPARRIDVVPEGGSVGRWRGQQGRRSWRNDWS